MSQVGSNQVYVGWEGKLYFAAMGDNEFEDRLAIALENITKGYRQPLIFGTPIARIQNIAFTISNVLREYFEIGEKCPVEIRTGNFSFGGSIRSGLVNARLLRFLIGASSPDAMGTESGVILAGGPQHESPTFNIGMDLNNSGTEETDLRATIIGAKLSSWSPAFSQDNFILENIAFRARGFRIEEAGL